jgi:hypothetical protein
LQVIRPVTTMFNSYGGGLSSLRTGSRYIRNRSYSGSSNDISRRNVSFVVLFLCPLFLPRTRSI